MPGSFDGGGQRALMKGAGARHPAGQDFGAVGHKSAEFGKLFVIDAFDFVDAEGADLPAAFFVIGLLLALIV